MLRNYHSNQMSDAPLARDSIGLYISLWATYCRWLDHSSIRRVDGLSISSSVSCMKLLLDIRRLFGTVWPCNGCLVSFTYTPSLFVQQHFCLLQGEHYHIYIFHFCFQFSRDRKLKSLSN